MESFVREGNVDGVMMLVRKQDKSTLMVDVARELMRNQKGKQLNGKFLMELLRELEVEDSEFFLEELARQLVRRLMNQMEKSGRQVVDIMATMYHRKFRISMQKNRTSMLHDDAVMNRMWRDQSRIFFHAMQRPVEAENGIRTLMVENLVMELWRELVRDQKENFARHLVRNIVRGLVKEQKTKLVMDLLRKLESEDQELTRIVARELVLIKENDLIEQAQFVTQMLIELKMKDEQNPKPKWELPLVEELAREVVIEQRWDLAIEVLHMLKYKMGIGRMEIDENREKLEIEWMEILRMGIERMEILRMEILRNLALERWKLGRENWEELDLNQEYKIVMQLLLELQCKGRDQDVDDDFLMDLRHVLMTEIAENLVNEGNIDHVLTLLRGLETEEKMMVMVHVAREYLRKENGKQLNGKFLMELLRDLDLKVLWSFLEALARELAWRLVHHLDNFKKDSSGHSFDDPCDGYTVEILVMQIIVRRSKLVREPVTYSNEAYCLQREIDRRIRNRISFVVEILVMELWRELVRNQKETFARHLVRNITRGLVKEQKTKLVVELLQKVECEDRELIGELLKDLARELVLIKLYRHVHPKEFLMQILREVKMIQDEEEPVMWALALVEELAREVVREDQWELAMEVLWMLEDEMQSCCNNLKMGIVRNLAAERWRLGNKDLNKLEWKQEWTLVLHLLWELQCKFEIMIPNYRFCLRDLWHAFMKEIWKESKWMDLVRELEMGPKHELAMQLLKELGEELDFVMELLKELLMQILTELSGEFGMPESLNRFVVMHYMEIITPEGKWEDLRTVVWMCKEAKLGADGEELVMELLVVHARKQVLTMEPVKAFVREIMSNLSRDQKLQHLWGVMYKHVYVGCHFSESHVMKYLYQFVMEERLSCEIVWRLGMQYWKVPIARKLVREKECKEVMSVVEVLGKKLAMEILGAVLDFEEEKGSENVQLVRVFRKHQRDMRRKEEVKRKRSFRKFVDDKVVARLCELYRVPVWCKFFLSKQRVMEFLQRSRSNEVKTTIERHTNDYEKALANKLLECVYVDCDVFNQSHLDTVAALYKRTVLWDHIFRVSRSCRRERTMCMHHLALYNRY